MKQYLKITILFFVALGAFYACNTSEANKKVKKIEALYQSIYEDSIFNPKTTDFNELMDLYKEFVTTYRDHEKVPEYLFKAGRLALNLNMGGQSVTYFNMIENQYSNTEFYPLSLFFQGYVYEDKLNNLDRAKEYYTLFIKKFPDHELADDAEMSIKNLGKTPEEIIREFEMKQKQAEENDSAS